MSNRYVITDNHSIINVRAVPAPRRSVFGALVKATALAAFYLVCTTVTPARADSITTNCSHNRHSAHCTTTYNGDAAPLTYTAEEIAEIKRRNDEWNSYCKPHDTVGSDGLLRAVYAHKNCDIGVYKPGKRAE